MTALNSLLALALAAGPGRVSRPEPGDGLALRRRRSVCRSGELRAVVAALGPIAFGHALAIALAGLAVGALGLVVPQRALLALGGAALLAFAAYKVATRFRHPRWVGMRVGPRELVLWSFLMASAHGAGLMLVPVLVQLRGEGTSSALAHAEHLGHLGHQPSGGNDALLPALACGRVCTRWRCSLSPVCSRWWSTRSSASRCCAGPGSTSISSGSAH